MVDIRCTQLLLLRNYVDTGFDPMLYCRTVAVLAASVILYCLASCSDASCVRDADTCPVTSYKRFLTLKEVKYVYNSENATSLVRDTACDEEHHVTNTGDCYKLCVLRGHDCPMYLAPHGDKTLCVLCRPEPFAGVTAAPSTTTLQAAEGGRGNGGGLLDWVGGVLGRKRREADETPTVETPGDELPTVVDTTDANDNSDRNDTVVDNSGPEHGDDERNDDDDDVVSEEGSGDVDAGIEDTGSGNIGDSTDDNSNTVAPDPRYTDYDDLFAYVNIDELAYYLRTGWLE